MRIPEILEYVRSKGYEVSDRQFRLWADGIPLPEPTVIRGGRGHGNVKDYPPGTENMVVDLARWQAEGVRTYDALAWLAWLKGYAIPGDRMREIFRHAYDEVVSFDMGKAKWMDLPMIALRFLCLTGKYRDDIREWMEWVSEYVPGHIQVERGSRPEAEVILDEKRNDPDRKESDHDLEKVFRVVMENFPEHPFTRENFPKVPGFNMRTVLKVFFRFRLEYVLTTIANSLLQLDVLDAIQTIPDDEIQELQTDISYDGLPDHLKESKEKGLDLSNPVYSLLIPIGWKFGQIPEINELLEFAGSEINVRSEAWFRKYPHRAARKMIGSMKREKYTVNPGYISMLKAIFAG